MLYDRYGRPLTTVRISVTNRCNYKCLFCHNEGDNWDIHEELSVEDYDIISEALSKIGVTRYKITGGEPLLRRDLPEIIERFKSTGKASDISLTTNGYYLLDYAENLVEKGLDRINVSMHSLREEVYYRITGIRGLTRVQAGISKLRQLPIKQLKINMVLLKNINDRELDDFIEYASRINAILQIIELHPVGKGVHVFKDFYIPASNVYSLISRRVSKIKIRRDQHNRPLLVLDNGVIIEIVSPVNNPLFCSACNRIRLLSNGALTPCLNWENKPLTILHILRNNEISRAEKVEAIIDVLRKVNDLREPFVKCYIDKSDGESAIVSNLFRLSYWMPMGLPKKSKHSLEVVSRRFKNRIKHE